MKINIAIDGPAGSGKSSVGYELAKKLNYQFVDTGLTYRAFTYFCVKENINFSNYEEIKQLLAKFNYEIKDEKIYLNNEDITDKLQTAIVLDNINKLTSLDFVRTAMVMLQQKLGSKKGTVMVGRDITTVVLPTAELKIYLTASIESRAKRRWTQNLENNFFPNNLEDIANKLAVRDASDMNRTVGPLTISPDAIVIDSSDMTFGETVSKIYQLVNNLEKVGN